MTRHIIHCYIRVSTDDQTLEQQKQAIMAAYPPGTEFVWYAEKMSAWDGKRRPEWEAFKQAIRAGRAREICCVSISRLARNQREALILLDMCLQREVKVKIIDTNFDFSSPFGLTIFTMFAEFAQMDSDMKSANIKRKLKYKKEKEGWKSHGSPPDCFAKKTKEKAAEVYTMSDAGRSGHYIARMLEISDNIVYKILKNRGNEMLTRDEYAERFPNWHLLPSDQQPRLIDGIYQYPNKLAVAS